MGMHNLYLRQKVLVAVEQFASMQEQLASKYGQTNGASGANPSAPPQENIPSAPPPAAFASAQSSAPSAPPIETFQSTECCVCMNNKVRNFFDFSCMLFFSLYFLRFPAKICVWFKHLTYTYSKNFPLFFSLVWYHLLTMWTRLLLCDMWKQQRQSLAKLPPVPNRYYSKSSLNLKKDTEETERLIEKEH